MEWYDRQRVAEPTPLSQAKPILNGGGGGKLHDVINKERSKVIHAFILKYMERPRGMLQSHIYHMVQKGSKVTGLLSVYIRLYLVTTYSICTAVDTQFLRLLNPRATY